MRIIVQWIKYKARRKLAVLKKKKQTVHLNLTQINESNDIEIFTFRESCFNTPCMYQENNEPNMAASIKYVQK